MFEREIKKFRDSQSDLIVNHPNGGFVVIKDDEILGVWNDRLDALKAGISEYGNVPFLIKNIREEIDSVTNVIHITRNIEFV